MNITARDRFILFVTATYTALALAWIFLSDRLLPAFDSIDALIWLSTAKGVFFVLVTAAGFFFVLRAVPPANAVATPTLLDAVATGMTPERRARWLMYGFAVAISVVTLLVRQSISGPFGNRPFLILFMLPVILSALLGGLGPGLAATALCALGVDYFGFAPSHSFSIANVADQLQWGFLIVNGVAVSLLSEILRRSLAKVEINRRLLDTVISGTSDAVFVKDAQGRYLLANTAAAGFIGKPPGEILGRDDMSLFSELSARTLMALDRTVMEGGQTQTHEEHVILLNGQTKVFLVTKGPMFDEAGRIVGLFGISRDISERKQAEDEVRHLAAELEERVVARTAELNAANIELEDLAYALTHNLRAPLRAIRGFSRELVQEQGGALDGDGRAKLDQIIQAGDLMAGQVDGILALLRCTRGVLRRETVDISALAMRCFEELAGAEPGRRVEWTVEPGLIVSADAAMIGMAVMQLLDNAWKFTGGKADAVIRVQAEGADGRRGVRIADNGAGFAMAHTHRLFQPFQRLHRRDEFPGIGIGLAIVQRIIHRHGGEIRADGRPGLGATFSFTLPASGSGKTP